MAIDTLQKVVDALPGQSYAIVKATVSLPAAGRVTHLWTYAGFPPAGAAPSSGMAGDVPTATTTGAFPLKNPASGSSYIGKLTAGCEATGTLHVYDRLWHHSGIAVATTTAQTVNSVALTRPDALGADVEAWFDIYATTGAGAATPTIVYTDQDGTAAQTGTVLGYLASSVAGRTFPISLAAGDTGVRSIQSITLGVSLTSGTVGLVLRRRLASIGIPAANQRYTLSAIEAGMAGIPNSACLEFLYTVQVSLTGPPLCGEMSIIQG